MIKLGLKDIFPLSFQSVSSFYAETGRLALISMLNVQNLCSCRNTDKF